MNTATSESTFEAAIEQWLVEHSGYERADHGQFDAELALDPQTLIAFLQATQPDELAQLAVLYGADLNKTLVSRIAAECDRRGLLDVIRNGVKDRGQHLRLAYFRPPTSLNPETAALYQQNRLTVMRQVFFDLDSKKSIDMLLSLNGLPIATVELKNAFTGQKSINAILQYIKDRQPTARTKLLQFKKRALVHFAVDTDEVYMTTRLSGRHTFFLPFNKGCDGGKGNPGEHKHATGYKTGYLWEEVWQRDSWLNILQRYMHLQVEEEQDLETGKTKRSERLIFPRYHQLTATRSLLDATLEKGVGANYLVQHSAGSGKTNTISWTAHQLANLHDANDQPLFHSVIVVSDRRNLDRQLQDNIYQMEHTRGVVAKIDEHKYSSDLAEELNKGTKIIITTLQKFSFLLDKVQDFSNRRFAVIVDEAHSSQSGRSAGNLRGVLGGSAGAGKSEEDLLALAEEEEAQLPAEPELEDLVLAEARSRGPQPNLSFYAFTATPKAKTLELFGVTGADGKPYPFHLYSMRQAIEESFIKDVLLHYTTYKTYYKLAKAIDDDPDVDEKKAKRSIARFLSLHPYSVAQKTEIMVEHFRHHTCKKINGRAKAMVVTRSRLHAVRYKQAFDKYIGEQGYTDLKTLVAFSGTVDDPKHVGTSYSEPAINGFSEKELPDRFASQEYHILIVAEKYQTGFDQPLLHTMFVDKPLAGLRAVQTLSRLNRCAAGKTDTFVLDFANTAEDIKEGFRPYYEQTELSEPTDHNHVYTLGQRLRESPVLRAQDIDDFAAVYFKPYYSQKAQDHGRLNKFIDPAVERYKQEYRDPGASGGEERYTEEGEEFKSLLRSFLRFYGFLSQIICWQDAELEKLYAYSRYLLTKLPYRSTGGMIHLEDELALSAYRNELTFAGSAALTMGDTCPVDPIGETGTGQVSEDAKSPLSKIIEQVNEQLGTDWKNEDLVLFDQITEDMISDAELVDQAKANTVEQFREVFFPKLDKAFIDRLSRNSEIVNAYMSNPSIQKLVAQAMLMEFYGRARGMRM